MSHSPAAQGAFHNTAYMYIEHPCTVKKECVSTETAYVSMQHFDSKRLPFFTISECFRQLFRRNINYRPFLRSGSGLDPDSIRQWIRIRIRIKNANEYGSETLVTGN